MNSSFVIADLMFYATNEGGLRASFDRYADDPDGKCTIGFLMDLDGHYYDFRICHLPTCVILGRRQEVMIRFLSPDAVIPRLRVGGKYSFWYNGRTIGEFVVLEIHDYAGVDTRGGQDVNLWVARALRRPDFYLLSESCNLPVACFMSFHVNPGGSDSVCGVRVDPPLAVVSKVTSRECQTGGLVLYSFDDIFDLHAHWPRQVVILQRHDTDEGKKATLCIREEGVLYKDWSDAIRSRANHMYLRVIHEDADKNGVLQRAKTLLMAAGRL